MRRLAPLLIAIAAAVNLTAAVVVVMRDPSRAGDLNVVYDWCQGWLSHAERLYTESTAAADYPPPAIVLLSPMALVPERWLVPVWTALSLVLAPLLAFLGVRCASRDRRAWVVPVLLVLCWSCMRTLLQFSVLSLAGALWALWIVDSSWIASGLVMGLALFKPHIAGPIALWMLITGRARQVAVAVAVTASGWTVYDIRIGESPLATLAGYARVLGEQYGGVYGLTGQTSVRGWAQLAAADPRVSDGLWIAMAALLLAAVCWLARRDPRRPLDEGGLAVPGLFCLWSLLTFYHNGNNLILALPAFAWLWFLDDRLDRASRWIPIVIWQAVMMYDVPARLGSASAPEGWLRIAAVHFDRAAILIAFVYVSVLWYRQTRTTAS